MEVGAPLHTIPGSGSPSPCVDRRSLEDKSSNKQHCAKNRACGAAGELSAEKNKEIFFCFTVSKFNYYISCTQNIYSEFFRKIRI